MRRRARGEARLITERVPAGPGERMPGVRWWSGRRESSKLTLMGSDYLVGTASERQRAVGVQSADLGDGMGAVEGAGMHHAVAPAAVIEGSDIAVALCGATVRVWRAAPFPYPGADSDDIDQVCLELVAAARRSAASEADEQNP